MAKQPAANHSQNKLDCLVRDLLLRMETNLGSQRTSAAALCAFGTLFQYTIFLTVIRVGLT
jgi:hypothetical protein